MLGAVVLLLELIWLGLRLFTFNRRTRPSAEGLRIQVLALRYELLRNRLLSLQLELALGRWRRSTRLARIGLVYLGWWRRFRRAAG